MRAILIDGVGRVRYMAIEWAMPDIRIPVTRPMPMTPEIPPPTAMCIADVVTFRRIGLLSDGSYVYGYTFERGPQFCLHLSELEVSWAIEPAGRAYANRMQLRAINRHLECCVVGPGPILVLDHVQQTIGTGYSVKTWFIGRSEAK